MHILGIDLGTTSVKAVIYDSLKKSVLFTYSKDTLSTIKNNEDYYNYHEQDVSCIFNTVAECLVQCDINIKENIKYVVLCGQMHGMVLWNNHKDTNGLFIHSNLITWMDQRCDNEFIKSLPEMPSKLIGKMPISTGYGCASLFHLQKYKGFDYISQWTSSGNIVDFMVSILCDNYESFMCPQMAFSWGYFDLTDYKWYRNELERANFPVNLLPKIKESGTIIGECKSGLFDIPKSAKVLVGMADLGCSMFAALNENLNAAINFSTSSQFGIRIDEQDLNKLFDENNKLNIPKGLVLNPFINRNEYLLVACSLNGGNVLADFVDMISNWFGEITGTIINKNKIWDKLASYDFPFINAGSGDEKINCPIIQPIIYGERFDPSICGNVTNILPNNSHDLSSIYTGICKGLIENLLKMLPSEIISKVQVKKLTCNGGVIRRHKCVKDSIKYYYGPYINNIVFLDYYDACLGAVEYVESIEDQLH